MKELQKGARNLFAQTIPPGTCNRRRFLQQKKVPDTFLGGEVSGFLDSSSLIWYDSCQLDRRDLYHSCRRREASWLNRR